jgi:hypothetical protein
MYIYQLCFFTNMTMNIKLKRKLFNLNIRTYLLYIRCFYVYMTIMIWWYWFWIYDSIFEYRTIFSIVHIFMYMIIYTCFILGETLIWDKLMWKETNLWEIYLGESKKDWLMVYFLARSKLTSLVGFFSNHLLHNKKYLHHILLNIF